MIKQIVTFAMAGALYASATHAQPDPNNVPKAANPENRAALRLAQIRTQLVTRTKTELARLGVTDPAQQETVSNFVADETVARQTVMQKGRNLSVALRNDALTNTQVAAALNDYLATIEDEKSRRETAITNLKKSVDYTKNPKLETWLTLMGFVGEGPMVNAMPGGNVNIRINQRNRDAGAGVANPLPRNERRNQNRQFGAPQNNNPVNF